MSETVYMNREWFGSPVPPHITTPLPTPAELVRCCTGRHPLRYSMSLTWPPDAKSPTYFIKYAHCLIWNGLAATKMAHDGLRHLHSPVKAPDMYYGCQVEISYKKKPTYPRAYRAYFVMDYVRGKTAAQLLDDAGDDEGRKDRIYRQVAFALSELYRIPVPNNSRPAAVNGELIRHELFVENQAPHHYNNVTELEDHLNKFLSMTKSKRCVENLAEEPMIFCYSDIWLGNFIIDDENSITVVDFDYTNILPSSFSRFTLAEARYKIHRDIRDMVRIPTTEGIDNTPALYSVAGPMVLRWSAFAKEGQRLLGSDTRDAPNQVHRVVTDEHGQPVTMTL